MNFSSTVVLFFPVEFAKEENNLYASLWIRLIDVFYYINKRENVEI